MVRLEPISLAHAADVQALASDPLIAATSNVPHPYPADGSVTWIRYTLAQRELGSEANFAILAPATMPGTCGTLVGVCGVLNIAGSPRRGEMGYWIGVPYWNRGYASAAARALVRTMFEEHGIDELYSSCLVRNVASFRVLEKTGFRHVGYGTHPDSKWGPHDRFALFELTKQEWVMHNSQSPTPDSQSPTSNSQVNECD
ncbi:MAG: GNAT family N-acetyltransferase [Vicinamibacterales bacterium]